MGRVFFKNLIFICAEVVILLVLVDSGLRLFIQPEADCFGSLFGRRLPPFAVIPWEKIPDPRERAQEDEQPYEELVVDGQQITRGDLGGKKREDSLIGFVPQENYLSRNGWWQTNSLGARARTEIFFEVPAEKKRLLVFGESFTDGTRLRQEQAWVFLLDQKSVALEVVNFGVGGYSMAQSYLYYQKQREALEHDVVFLVFVPQADLARDINTIRYLWAGWKSYKVMPRYVLTTEGNLLLVPSPYEDLAHMLLRNKSSAALDPALTDHLEKYDRFYFREVHQTHPFFDFFVFGKLYLLQQYHAKLQRIQEELYSPEGEAVQVTMAIAGAMMADVQASSKEFRFILLPSHEDVSRYRSAGSFRSKWDQLSEFAAQKLRTNVIDLMPEFEKQPAEVLDYGYDRHHYGPLANQFIADVLWDRYAA